MIVAPIAVRELRLASLRAWTWWGRAGLVAVAGSLMFWMLGTLYGSVPSNQLGGRLFRLLGEAALWAGLLMGVVLTADCLGQEQRDGTIGLLFPRG